MKYCSNRRCDYKTEADCFNYCPIDGYRLTKHVNINEVIP